MKLVKRTPTLLWTALLGVAALGCSDTGSKVTGSGGSSGSPPAGGTGGSSAVGGGSGASGRGGSGGSVVGGMGSGSAGAAGAPSLGGSGGDGARAGSGTSGDGSTTAGASGAAGTGIAGAGGASAGTSATGGAPEAGRSGGSTGGSGGAGAAGAGGIDTGTCTPSKATGTKATGSGPHEVIVETNADPGIAEGTIFRPADLGGAEKYPIFVWGEGGCSQDGLSNATAMAEIASHGYFVVADGTPNGSGNRTMDRSQLAAMGAPLVAYIDWAIAENAKPCSAYYQSLEPTQVASNGFSCGGLMSQGTVLDPRILTWGINSSGMAGATQDFYDAIHTPVLFVEGGPDDIAYDGGQEGYDAISKLDVPVLWFSKDLGHGGDLFAAGGGDFTKLDLAWLNWWLKGDETATGKGLLVGAGCSYCSDAAWEVKSAHIP